MLSLYKEAVKTDRIVKFTNDLSFYRYGELKPFAFRSADIDKQTAPEIDGRTLFELGAFTIYENRGEIYCIYHAACKIIARITPLNGKAIDSNTLRKIKEYLADAYLLDPYTVSVRSAFEKYDRTVSAVADFCGCLTDIMSEYNAFDSFDYYPKFNSINCAHIAISLPIISLMYRRISALRGFNFKVTFKDSLACLIFSAKVIFPNAEVPSDVSDIREYSVLRDILGGDGLIVGARLKTVEESGENGEGIYRLSIAILPQTVDPRGILRAPVLGRQAENIIDSLDIDLDGKY